MPLESIAVLMQRARGGSYAVGYFESWNLESLQGVVDAAEETRSPVIIGFNGAFLSGPERLTRERLTLYAALGKAAAESASVPCGLIFNECPDDSWVRQAVTSGFNLVMPADPKAPPAEYANRVSKLTNFAHEHGVAVEAELGELPCWASDDEQAAGSLTDPAAAADFVDHTGVDLLAVSVGNVHIKIRGSQGLDLLRLAEIRGRVPVPLVLHGGTGIAAESLREAIALGVSKVNYGTYLKQAYLEAVRAALGRECAHPHRLLGMGGTEDILVAGRLAVRGAVVERIGLLGCCGRADT
jgi:ketose-bisphosphate aldolase